MDFRERPFQKPNSKKGGKERKKKTHNLAKGSEYDFLAEQHTLLDSKAVTWQGGTRPKAAPKSRGRCQEFRFWQPHLLRPSDRRTDTRREGRPEKSARDRGRRPGSETHRKAGRPAGRPTLETRPARRVRRRNKEIAGPGAADKQPGSRRLRARRKGRLGAGGAPEKGCQGRKPSEVTNYAQRPDFFFFFLSEFSYLAISMASTRQDKAITGEGKQTQSHHPQPPALLPDSPFKRSPATFREVQKEKKKRKKKKKQASRLDFRMGF